MMLEEGARGELLQLGGYRAYIKSLNPPLWFRMNEPSGVAMVNSGSLGPAYNGVYTLGAGALAQVGKLGPGEAVLFDGANTIGLGTNGPYGNYAQITHAFLAYVNSAGEGNVGDFSLVGGSNATRVRFTGATRTMDAGRQATGNALSITTTTFPLHTWCWLFVTFDNAGDRKTHLHLGQAGAVNECAYASQVAATGVMTDLSGGGFSIIIGNNATQAATFDGLIDEALIFNKVLTPAEMLQIVKLSAA